MDYEEFTLNERLRAEFATMEPVYVDGWAGVLNLGANFVTYYYRWAVSENGTVRVPALAIVRPRASMPCGDCVIKQILNGQRQPMPRDLLTKAMQ